jgi:hypothetical protein
MLFGDNPIRINEREDLLGNNLYTMMPDIWAIMQAANLYVYCANNPIMWTDPSGLWMKLATIVLTKAETQIAKAATRIANTAAAQQATQTANQIINSISQKVNSAVNTISGRVSSGTTAAANTAQRAAPAAQQAFKLNAGEIQHISKHVPNVFARQVPHLNDFQLTNKLDQTFFNPNWTQAQVNSRVEQGVNMLRDQGITRGEHMVSIAGEQIRIVFNNAGGISTAYGLHRLTPAFFGR